MNVEEVGEYCVAVLQPTPGRKTKVWAIDAGIVPIGYVRWFGRWRGYAFTPLPGAVFEQKCLRAISDFIESKTKKHRAKWRTKT